MLNNLKDTKQEDKKELKNEIRELRERLDAYKRMMK